MRYRSVTISGSIIIIVIIFLYTCHWDDLLWQYYSLPRCRFSDQLSVFAECGLHPDRNRIAAASQLGPTSQSEVTVRGQATVFYVWCGTSLRPFEFRNYLSVRSAVRVLRPDNVWFYYESEPQIDKNLYNTWWQELIDDVPFFHRRSLRDVGGQLPAGTACDGPGRPSVDFVYALVSSRGGTFVDESTVLVARPPDDGVTLASDITDKSDVRLRLLKADRGISCPVGPFNASLEQLPSVVQVFKCSSDSELTEAKSTLCLHVAR